MENIRILIDDIFAMNFDVVIPISGCIVAVLIALVLFLIRYVGYHYNRFKYQITRKKRERTAWREQIRESSLELEAEQQIQRILKDANKRTEL